MGANLAANVQVNHHRRGILVCGQGLQVCEDSMAQLLDVELPITQQASLAPHLLFLMMDRVTHRQDSFRGNVAGKTSLSLFFEPEVIVY
jgi:hypothetical protein